MMPWVKLDDQFPDHPKVLAAGPLASWLYVCGLGYCGRLLTDGFIPDGQVRKLADVENATELASRLVEVGLWDREEGGYRVHDYHEYQPSAEKVKAERAAAAERMRKARSPEVRANTNRTNAARSPELRQPRPDPSRTRPTPDPDPDLDDGADAPTAPAARAREPRYSAGFEQFWREWNRAGTVTKGHGSKQDSYAAWKRLGLDKSGADGARQEVYEGLERWRACGRWRRGYVRDCERWLGKRQFADEPPVDPEDLPDAGRAPRGVNGQPPGMIAHIDSRQAARQAMHGPARASPASGADADASIPVDYREGQRR